MRLVTPVVALVLVLALPKHSVSEDDWWRLKADDSRFDFASFQDNIDVLKWHLEKFGDFTELLANSSDLGHRFLDFGNISDDQLVIIKVKGKDLKQFTQNLAWDQQHIGIANLMIAIRGYGLISQVQILKLKLENLRLKKSSQDEIQKAQASLNDLQKQLDEFLSKGQWVD